MNSSRMTLSRKLKNIDGSSTLYTVNIPRGWGGDLPLHKPYSYVSPQGCKFFGAVLVEIECIFYVIEPRECIIVATI